MKMQVRVLLSLLVALALMFLAGCGGSYNCAVTFGSSSCTPSGSGLGGGGTGGTGGGGGGGGGATAFAYAVDQIGGTTTGTMDGYELNAGAGTFVPISGFNAPLIPPTDPSLGVVVAQEQFLYTAFSSTGQIYGWSVDKTSGALTAITGSPYSVSYLGSVGVSGFNQLSMITNPAGTLLFVADAGDDEIWVYEIAPLHQHNAGRSDACSEFSVLYRHIPALEPDHRRPGKIPVRDLNHCRPPGPQRGGIQHRNRGQ